MIETVEILKVIKNINQSKLDTTYLRVKNTLTNEVKGVSYNYVADEILFLFTNENVNNRTVSNYLNNLKAEAEDKCWNSYVEIPERYTHPDCIPEDAVDELTLSDEEMSDGRYTVVTNLETRVYFGDKADCPIKNFKETSVFKGIEVSEEAITLLY